jgi:hypothetical protein
VLFHDRVGPVREGEFSLTERTLSIRVERMSSDASDTSCTRYWGAEIGSQPTFEPDHGRKYLLSRSLRFRIAKGLARLGGRVTSKNTATSFDAHLA